MLHCKNKSQSKISVFCFPKLLVKQCIIKIEVKWENYKFEPRLWRYRTIEYGISALQLVLQEQYSLPKNPDKCTLMPLTLTECRYFCGSTIQLRSSTHLIVMNRAKVFKVLYDTDEIRNIEKAIIKFTQTKPKFSIFYTVLLKCFASIKHLRTLRWGSIRNNKIRIITSKYTRSLPERNS